MRVECSDREIRPKAGPYPGNSSFFVCKSLLGKREPGQYLAPLFFREKFNMLTVMPSVSVVIPCFNQGHFVDEAVDSVLAQSFDDFEIIIVNDGSTDGHTDRLPEDYPRERARVLTTNQGLAAARNNGIAAAQGTYILPLDADDRILPGYLEKSVRREPLKRFFPRLALHSLKVAARLIHHLFFYRCRSSLRYTLKFQLFLSLAWKSCFSRLGRDPFKINGFCQIALDGFRSMLY